MCKWAKTPSPLQITLGITKFSCKTFLQVNNYKSFTKAIYIIFGNLPYMNMKILLLMQTISFRFPDFRNASEVKTKLAFTVITHDQLGRFEILLNMIFRPYNAYCIYVGSNTNKIYKQNGAEETLECPKGSQTLPKPSPNRPQTLPRLSPNPPQIL